MYLPGMKYTWLEEQEPTGVTTVTFQPVNQGFDDLVILCLGIRNDSASTSRGIRVQYNNDTTATNYARALFTYINTGFPATGGSGNDNYIMRACPADALAGVDGVIWIPDYAKTGIVKVSQFLGHQPDITSTANHAAASYLHFQTQWNNTSPIVAINLPVDTDNYTAPSKFVLYGLSYE